MVNGWVGYDETGALRLDPSQDDILDSDKPVDWAFSTEEAELLGLTYRVKNTEVYNDYIVVGEQLSDYSQPNGRAQIFDSRSPVSIDAIGRKTIRVSKAGFGTDTQCQDYADFMVKQSSVLQRAVTISCAQIMHIRGNRLVTVTRTDKPGSPTERHLVHGFSRPLAGVGTMTINATSVQDFSVAALGSRSAFYFWSENPFTLSSYTGKTWNGTLEYSVNSVDWTVWDGTAAISSGAHSGKNTIFLRGIGNTKITGYYSTPIAHGFVFTGSDIRAQGNIEILLDYETVIAGAHPPFIHHAFCRMFYNCTNLVKGPTLGAVSLKDKYNCYDSMFYWCTALTEMCDMAATELSPSCCYQMYAHCTSLTGIKPFRNDTSPENCFAYMLAYCTALESVPSLPAVTLKQECYTYMFAGCTKLKFSETQTGDYQTAYRVPSGGRAVTVGSNWCYRMLYNTGGTFTQNPVLTRTYWTQNSVV